MYESVLDLHLGLAAYLLAVLKVCYTQTILNPSVIRFTLSLQDVGDT